MSLRPELLAAPAYAFTARAGVVKLDQNESAYDLPEPLKAEVARRLMALPFNRYPEIAAQTLRETLAARHAWEAEGVVLSGGSNILIQALIIAAGLGRTVLSVKPTFSVYALQAQVLGARLVEVPLEADFGLPLAALERELGRSSGVFFLANPAAPTGNLHPRAALERLADAAGENWLLVVDEAYQQFSGEDFSDLARHYPQVVSLRTFSKAWGLAGVRLGYALARPEVGRELQKALLPFSLSSLQVSVAEVALEHDGWLQARISETLGERKRLALELEPLVTLYPSSTNFLLFRVADAEATYRGLLERGVVVRRQDHLPGLGGCLRVSVGQPGENDAFLQAMRELFPRAQPEAVRG